MKITDNKIIFLSAALAIIGSIFLSHTVFFERVQHLIDDKNQYFWADPADFSDIIIIDIDELSLTALQSQLGSWPYDRYIYAALTRYLREAGARQLIYDIVFAEPRSGDEVFIQELSLTPGTHIAAITQYERYHDLYSLLQQYQSIQAINSPATHPQGAVIPHKDLIPVSQIGLITLTPGFDATVRKIPLVFNIDDHQMPAMAISALMQKRNDTLDFDWGKKTASLNQYQWPVNADGTVAMKYPSNMKSMQLVPFYKVLLDIFGQDSATPEAGVDSSLFKDKTVFIGSTATTLGDYTYIPNEGRIPGLQVLAVIYHNLKHGSVLIQNHVISNIIVTLPWLLIIGGILFLRGLKPISLYIGYITASSISAFIVILLYSQFNIQGWYLMPALIGFLFIIIATLIKAIHLQFERQKLYFEKQAAEEARELKAKFLAHMTHELRTPLTAIMGYNQLIRMDRPDDKTMDEFLDIIESSSEHLLNLINNILDQSKIDAEQLELILAGHNIHELLYEVTRLLHPLADKKQLQLINTIEENVPQILQIDRVRLKQIILNLIGNALKFTDQGHIEVITQWQDNRLSISVQDTGPGIAKDDLEKIFQSFQQTSAVIASEISGTGLGLTISRNLAGLMGGGISVASEPGSGSSFTLDIEALTVEETPQEHSLSEDRKPVPRKIETILLAEDNPDSRHLIMLFLMKGGYTVITAEDGQQALEKAQQSPDLILMDVNMPAMNGDEVTRKLRAQGLNIPIMALTAVSDQQILGLMRDAGCNGYIPKPVDSDTLLSSIQSLKIN